eukprot:2338638-Pyramimonas_sp.AAC.2
MPLFYLPDDHDHDPPPGQALAPSTLTCWHSTISTSKCSPSSYYPYLLHHRVHQGTLISFLTLPSYHRHPAQVGLI